MRASVLLCLLLAILMFGRVWAQESPPGSPPTQGSQLSLLVRASLGRVRVGLFDGELDVVRVGLGLGWGRFGIIASTGYSELAPSGWAGDYMFEITGRPIECDLTYGLVPGRHLDQPVLYVHGEYATLPRPYGLRGGGVSAGALFTYWAVSGGVQVTWRRSVLGTAAPWDRNHDFYSVGVTLDLGGWWPIRLGTPEEDSWD
jgi:hypothetical protein